MSLEDQVLCDTPSSAVAISTLYPFPTPISPPLHNFHPPSSLLSASYHHSRKSWPLSFRVPIRFEHRHLPLSSRIPHMRLLDTKTLKLKSFVSPEAVKEGYVILSHVWDEKEDSFQDLEAIHARCFMYGERPHDLVSKKIKKCCEVAARRGYKWVWIDTCCIDKTSSAELSEAINSMYRYYALSLVCFAYLSDIHVVRSDPRFFFEIYVDEQTLLCLPGEQLTSYMSYTVPSTKEMPILRPFSPTTRLNMTMINVMEDM
ncbi:heterokaryon incompatibility protein-domain-containing protein [Earliella scabrosa]|nr:heterokaryon incompatibility protein-domain-containing protein [Earliella scabrosa]